MLVMKRGEVLAVRRWSPASSLVSPTWLRQYMGECEQTYMYMYIRESVDSLCRDGVDTPMLPYIGKAFTRTNFEDLSLFRYMIMVC